MTPEQQQQLQEHVREIAKLLHADAAAHEMPMETLGEIEMTVRRQLLEYVSPKVGNFLSSAVQDQRTDSVEP